MLIAPIESQALDRRSNELRGYTPHLEAKQSRLLAVRAKQGRYAVGERRAVHTPKACRCFDCAEHDFPQKRLPIHPHGECPRLSAYARMP